MNTYIGTKAIRAVPMTRIAYNQLRGWPLPADENGADEGYLVEYLDGGKGNVPGYSGYVSWSPKEVFDRAYRPLTDAVVADVRLSFNPSANPVVDELKLAAAAFLAAVAKATQGNPNGARCFALARTEAETACMWAVKGATA